MKTLRLLFVFLALCLTGCALSTSQHSPSTIPPETILTSAAPTAGNTTPPETIIPTTTAATQPPAPEEEDFVPVLTYIPDAIVQLPYSTKDNFTGQIIYEFDEAWIRYGTVKKLMAVQEELREQGLTLKFWDCFRPTAAQFKLWEVFPDANYVSDPHNGFSSHSRGNTVDVTLAYADGQELSMPTGFDDFSKLADRDYSDCSAEAAANVRLLETLMVKHGFKPYAKEWWHYSDTEVYPVEENFYPEMP